MKINTRKLLNCIAIVILIMSSISITAQTVTTVFPTRITTNSEITILGSDFDTSTSLSIPGLSIDDVDFISATEMRLRVVDDGDLDISGNLNVMGTPTSFTLDYIAPTPKELKNGPTSNVTKITEIFTTYNGFWRSSEYKMNPTDLSTWPNNSHDLLGFTFDGVTYSTGVNDQLLTDNGISFSPQLFFAYTTDGVSGTTQSLNFLATGDLVDGEENEGTVITSPNILGTTVYDAITDGVNGLDLGTGITNFNVTDDVQFFSAGGNLGGINDAIPDFLITQIARAGGTDVYYYADDSGNVVGRPIKLTIVEEDDSNGDAFISEWRLDLYSYPSGLNYGLAEPMERVFTPNDNRPLRVAAFKLEDFEINASNVGSINNINMLAGGSADLAFLAYNRGSFDIKTPVFSQFPVSRFVCRLPNSSDITFVATGEVSGTPTGDPLENLSYQWFKYNEPIPGETGNTLTLSGVLDSDDFAVYKVRVSNGFGAVTAPVTLSQGGTPTFWDGTQWNLPPTYIAAGIAVADEDRQLVFSEDYIQNEGVLEGCDCLVTRGREVIFSSGTTLKLYDEFIAETETSVIFRNNSSLIQTKDISENGNGGRIIYERNASNNEREDLLFWSSPVNRFDLEDITDPFNVEAFIYDVDILNPGGTSGDYVLETENMERGKGYLVEVPNAFENSVLTAPFSGRANNGPYTIIARKSPDATEPVEELRNWNLIGNPYPSAINFEEFIMENPEIEGHVRIWSNGNTSNTTIAGEFYSGINYQYTDNYVTYNLTGSTPDMFGGNIATGQGFFVQLSESSGNNITLNFENTMRYNDAEVAYNNSQFLQNNISTSVVGSPDNQKIWLSLANNSNESSVALIGYVNGATNGSDRMYDAFSDGSDMRIYSTLNSSKLAIQGRALPFDVDDTVPIGVDLPNTGGYSIGIDQLQGNIFGGSQDIFLQDVLLDVVHDLRSGPYSFTGISGSTTDRFILKYTSEPLSIDNPERTETFAFISNNTLNVQSAMAIKDITVYDVTGKEIVVYMPNSSETSFVTPFNFSRGLYIAVIKVGDGNMIKVTRKLLN